MKVFAFIFMLFVISALDCKNLAKARKGATHEEAKPVQEAIIKRAVQECGTTEEELNEIEAQTHRELENTKFPKGARQEMAGDIEKKFNLIKYKVGQVATHIEECTTEDKTKAVEAIKKIKERIGTMEVEAKKKFGDLFDGEREPLPRKIADAATANTMLDFVKEQMKVANATLNTIAEEGKVDTALSNSVKKEIAHAILARFDEVEERGTAVEKIFRKIHASKFIAKEVMQKVGEMFEAIGDRFNEIHDHIEDTFPMFEMLMSEMRRGDGKRPPTRPDGKRPPRPDGKRPPRPDGKKPPKDDEEEEEEKDGKKPAKEDAGKGEEKDGKRPIGKMMKKMKNKMKDQTKFVQTERKEKGERKRGEGKRGEGKRGKGKKGKGTEGEGPQGTEGGRPERTEGERPERTEGERPERTEGGRPERTEGGRPERTEGERPEGKTGERPEGKTGERPEGKTGERPEGKTDERPEGKQPRTDEEDEDEE